MYKTIKTTMTTVLQGLDKAFEDMDKTFEQMGKTFEEMGQEIEKAFGEDEKTEHTLTEDIEVYGKDEQACIDAANAVSPKGYKLMVIEQRQNIWAAKLRRESKATF